MLNFGEFWDCSSLVKGYCGVVGGGRGRWQTGIFSGNARQWWRWLEVMKMLLTALFSAGWH